MILRKGQNETVSVTKVGQLRQNFLNYKGLCILTENTDP